MPFAVPVYSLGNGAFIYDDSSVDYAASQQAAEEQAAEEAAARALAGQMGLMEVDESESGEASMIHSTNDLWPEISVTNNTAYLVIHQPWNVSNGVWDLHHCTNLVPPIAWQRLLRTEPGQTNLAVPAPDAQGFYRLSPPNDLAANSSLGTNFWLAFFYMFHGSSNLSLYISSPVGATGTVTVPGFGITNAFAVTAGGVTNVPLTNAVMMVGYGAVETYGIHVTASQPVAVYALEYFPQASTACTCYPTPLLGTNYCVMAYPGFADVGYNSQFAIVATATNTTVWITPSLTANLDGHSTPYSTNLQQGEMYQIGSSYNTGDVTGTWITSDKPVAVFAGANTACVPDLSTGGRKSTGAGATAGGLVGHTGLGAPVCRTDQWGQLPRPRSLRRYGDNHHRLGGHDYEQA